MPFSFLGINGFVGAGAFWVSFWGSGFMFRDVSVKKLTYDESKMGWVKLFADVYFCLF